jgi:D-cysteine desulfhydrase
MYHNRLVIIRRSAVITFSLDSISVPHIELARLPTPMVPLRRLSEQVGGPEIWLKRDDLTDTAASGNKLRKLEFTVAQALEEDATTLITCGGVQSNHCRATAIVAAQLGLKCHLVLRGEEPETTDGNLLLDTMVGARVTYTSKQQWRDVDDTMAAIADQYRGNGEVPFCIPTGASDEIGLWGYIKAMQELIRDFSAAGINPDAIISATGSGGTLGGLLLGGALFDVGTTVTGFNVCDDEAYFVNKITADMQAWKARYRHPLSVDDISIRVIDGFVGPGYGVAEPHVFETIGLVARTEGIILDPVYTGKAFDAMLQEVRGGSLADASCLVFIHTGGIFGLFPQRESLQTL